MKREEGLAVRSGASRMGNVRAKRRNQPVFADYLLVPPGVPATVTINQASSIRVDTFMVGSFV